VALRWSEAVFRKAVVVFERKPRVMALDVVAMVNFAVGMKEGKLLGTGGKDESNISRGQQ